MHSQKNTKKNKSQKTCFLEAKTLLQISKKNIKKNEKDKNKTKNRKDLRFFSKMSNIKN